MSKKQKTTLKISKTPVSGFVFEQKYKDIHQYKLKSNGLTVLYKYMKGTGVLTTNITYKVGSKDEARGETGLAHMLEHMLFKPTKQDLAKKIDSGAMQFERETGCILNANTWKDRTTYFFSYPSKYMQRALSIEADRMQNVVLTDKEFLPERGNVLSEFDMNNGDPYFALSVQMVCNTFHSHAYGHETIGFREDIQNYTPEKLERFYRNYYRPDNATLTVVGDIEEKVALSTVKKWFGKIQKTTSPIPRFAITESKQEGLRRAFVERASNTNIVALGIKHMGFPSKSWFATSALLDVLAEGTDSYLHKNLIDTGLASQIECMIEPTDEQNLAIIFITLAPQQEHKHIEDKALALISDIPEAYVKKQLKKIVAHEITSELFARNSSLKIAMELTEYVAADAVDSYNNTEAILHSITSKQLIGLTKELFCPSNMTIGYFIGKQ